VCDGIQVRKTYKYEKHIGEPSDGDWCLVDLGDEIPQEATKVAHAMGMNFEEFMYMVLEEKLQSLRNDKTLMKEVEAVEWTPVLSEALESLSKQCFGQS